MCIEWQWSPYLSVIIFELCFNVIIFSSLYRLLSYRNYKIIVIGRKRICKWKEHWPRIESDNNTLILNKCHPLYAVAWRLLQSVHSSVTGTVYAVLQKMSQLFLEQLGEDIWQKWLCYLSTSEKCNSTTLWNASHSASFKVRVIFPKLDDFELEFLTSRNCCKLQCHSRITTFIMPRWQFSRRLNKWLTLLALTLC